ncbi:hypothetical protein ACQPZP_34580 [Spirillospora sp. CA-142024]|uniref:hypothetical protein n=1 Tax=Spirillospora sp. CA-142024 TaxID=3240036 RepID=UPI003D8CD1A8
MALERNERLAEQLASLQEEACRWRDGTARAYVGEGLELLQRLAVPGVHVPPRHREEFINVLEDMAVSARPFLPDASLVPYVSRLLDLLTPYDGPPAAAPDDPVAERLLRRDQKAARKQQAREQKAAERERKAEERRKRRLGLTADEGGPDRYWSPD